MTAAYTITTPLAHTPPPWPGNVWAPCQSGLPLIASTTTHYCSCSPKWRGPHSWSWGHASLLRCSHTKLYTPQTSSGLPTVDSTIHYNMQAYYVLVFMEVASQESDLIECFTSCLLPASVDSCAKCFSSWLLCVVTLLQSNLWIVTSMKKPCTVILLTVAEHAFSMCQYIQVKRTLLTHANEVGVRG